MDVYVYSIINPMTEKEKMLAGLEYNSRDPELLEMYHHCRAILLQYNNLDSTDQVRRHELLNSLFHKMEPGVWIEAPFYCDYGKNISIGANTFINVNSVFIDNNLITIGQNVLIGPGVHIYTSLHPVSANERIHNGKYKTNTKQVVIGDRVWVGGNSVIFPGVTIGNDTTIGAGSIVTKDIPGGVLAFGNPCKVVREL